MVITDRYDHVIDDKNRLAIPSQIRNAMDPERDGTRFYLVPEGRYLQLIPERQFERFADATPTGLMPAPEVARVRRFVYAMSSRLEPDKQGRVIIPDRFMRDSKNPDPLAQALLEREVTLVGNGDRIELWNRSEFLAHMRETVLDRVGIQATLQKMFGTPPAPPSSPSASGGQTGTMGGPGTNN
jgi:MraZ protein